VAARDMGSDEEDSPYLFVACLSPGIIEVVSPEEVGDRPRRAEHHSCASSARPRRAHVLCHASEVPIIYITDGLGMGRARR